MKRTFKVKPKSKITASISYPYKDSKLNGMIDEVLYNTVEEYGDSCDEDDLIEITFEHVYDIMTELDDDGVWVNYLDEVDLPRFKKHVEAVCKSSIDQYI